MLEVEDEGDGTLSNPRPELQGAAPPGRRITHSAVEQNLSKFGLLKDKSQIVARLLE